MHRIHLGLAGVAAALVLALPVAGEPAAAPPGAPTAAPTGTPPRDAALDAAADEYVRMVLAAGRHDPQFTDGYCGPPAWAADVARGAPVPLPELRSRARALLARLRALPASPRRAFMEGQVGAVEGYLLRLSGQPMSVGEEARRLFGIDPAPVPREELDRALEKVDAATPGERTVKFRVEILRKAMRVSRERLPGAMDAALALLRSRTAALVPLPAGERVRVEYVTGRPWRARSTYQGGFVTLVEVSTDAPVELGDVLELAAREGYPGHHVANVVLDDALARGKGWHEYWVHPRFSPESVVLEGVASAGLGVVLDGPSQRTFLHDVLAPLAGLRPSDVGEYLDYREAARPLRRADDAAVRMLLDEGRPDGEVEAFLEDVGLRFAPEAKRAIEGYRAARSYVLARSTGGDLVSAWIGKGQDRAGRLFGLLLRPVVPADLAPQD